MLSNVGKPLVGSKKVEVAPDQLQAHELELEKKKSLLAKVKTLRESWVLSRGRIDQRDPSKEYVWVNKDEERITWYEGREFSVTRSKVERTPEGTLRVVSGPKTQWVKEDGTHKRGDLILMEIDKDLKEALDTDSDLQAVEALEGSKQGFEAFATREGVPYNSK